MWDAFCELVGDDWEKYSRTDLICNSCSADVSGTYILTTYNHILIKWVNC